MSATTTTDVTSTTTTTSTTAPVQTAQEPIQEPIQEPVFGTSNAPKTGFSVRKTPKYTTRKHVRVADMFERNLEYWIKGYLMNPERLKSIDYFNYAMLGAIVEQRLYKEVPDIWKRVIREPDVMGKIKDGLKYANSLDDFQDDAHQNKLHLLEWCKLVCPDKRWKSTYKSYEVCVPYFSIPPSFVEHSINSKDKTVYSHFSQDFLSKMITGENAYIPKYCELIQFSNQGIGENGKINQELKTLRGEMFELYRIYVTVVFKFLILNAYCKHKPFTYNVRSFVRRNGEKQTAATCNQIHIFLHKDEKGYQGGPKDDSDNHYTTNIQCICHLYPKHFWDIENLVRETFVDELVDAEEYPIDCDQLWGKNWGQNVDGEVNYDNLPTLDGE